ncbi:hypothetical protein [Burkholderia aenigmatica]|uniref:hypothetical protein n=1 Tax=Burkholderia aenigmatica TaxID=2015348 RepID=UPI001FD4469B|nr:hypothetical protein [Burkholderia aenigmatica]
MDTPRLTRAQRRDATRGQFRARFGAFLRDRQALATASIDAYAARTGTTLPLPAQVLALGLTALCDGVPSCCEADARSPADALADAVLVGFLTHTVFGGVRG